MYVVRQVFSIFVFLEKPLCTDKRETEATLLKQTPRVESIKAQCLKCYMQVCLSKQGPMGKLFISIYFKSAFQMIEAAKELDVV